MEIGDLNHPQEKSRKKLLLIPAFLLLLPAVTVMAISFFTQTFPTISVPAGISLAVNCPTLTQEGVIPQGLGIIMFDCNGFGKAFTVSATGQTSVGFTLPAGYQHLYITNSTDCATINRMEIFTGQILELPVGNYNYCAQYQVTGAITLPSFDVLWSSG